MIPDRLPFVGEIVCLGNYRATVERIDGDCLLIRNAIGCGWVEFAQVREIIVRGPFDGGWMP